ncbi:MAG: hypothetical protein ACUVRD_06240 [Bacteroidia bacterium]
MAVSHTRSHPRIAWKFAYSTYCWGWDCALVALEVPQRVDFYGDARRVRQLREFLFSLPAAPPVGEFYPVAPESLLKRTHAALQKALQLPPFDIYHLHAPIFLPWVRLLRRHAPHAKILLDLHENLPENWRWDPAYSPFRRLMAPIFGWSLPKLISSLDGVTYAETGYEGLFRNVPSLLIPNAYLATPVEPVPFTVEWVCSGNLTQSWGVYAFAREQSDAQALLIGHAPQKRFLEGLIDSMGKNHILIGGMQQVPYSWVQACLLAAQNLWGRYEALPHFYHKIPTKFYEAVALRKPITYAPLPLWEAFFRRYGAQPQAPELYWKTYESRLKAFYEA